MNNNDNTELTAELEALKEQAYREGWEEGFNYCYSLMGHKAPINLPDKDVKSKITATDAFLRNLKW